MQNYKVIFEENNKKGLRLSRKTKLVIKSFSRKQRIELDTLYIIIK